MGPELLGPMAVDRPHLIRKEIQEPLGTNAKYCSTDRQMLLRSTATPSRWWCGQEIVISAGGGTRRYQVVSGLVGDTFQSITAYNFVRLRGEQVLPLSSTTLVQTYGFTSVVPLLFPSVSVTVTGSVSVVKSTLDASNCNS